MQTRLQCKRTQAAIGLRVKPAKSKPVVSRRRKKVCVQSTTLPSHKAFQKGRPRLTTLNSSTTDIAAGNGTIADQALARLRSDVRFGPLVEEHGAPPFKKSDVFDSLVRTIIYQQISGKAAASIKSRLLGLLGLQPAELMRPYHFKARSPSELRAVGLSERKAAYILDVGKAFLNNEITEEALADMSDDEVCKTLSALRGVGQWTCDMICMFSLQRPDILPVGDLAVRVGAAKLFNISGQMKPASLQAAFEMYRPYRSYATWYLWRVAHANIKLPCDEAV